MASIQLKPADFLRVHVKRMCIVFNSILMEEAIHILSFCTNIVDLAFWLSPSTGIGGIDAGASGGGAQDTAIAHVICQLPLQRLEVRYERILHIECESVRAGVLPGWCTTLTHLEVFYWSLCSIASHIPQPPFLSNLPALTHLGISWPDFDPELHEGQDLSSFLEMRPLLQVVVVDADTIYVDVDHVPVDDRIVYLPAGDDPIWHWANQGRAVSKWTLAERVVEERRRNAEVTTTSSDELSDFMAAMQT
jgi:hypothetical protein